MRFPEYLTAPLRHAVLNHLSKFRKLSKLHLCYRHLNFGTACWPSLVQPRNLLNLQHNSWMWEFLSRVSSLIDGGMMDSLIWVFHLFANRRSVFQTRVNVCANPHVEAWRSEGTYAYFNACLWVPPTQNECWTSVPYSGMSTHTVHAQTHTQLRSLPLTSKAFQ